MLSAAAVVVAVLTAKVRVRLVVLVAAAEVAQP
jgi:hypothetical protein